MSLLSVSDLTVQYPTTAAVRAFTLSMKEGDSVGLVGPSGCGKTQTALALMGLTGRAARVSGSIRFRGDELIGARESQLRGLRARHVAMVFQDPAAALNPYRRIGDQLLPIVIKHRLARGAAARRRVLDMLARTGLPDPERQIRAFPHELSGGMRQRVMLAAALIAEPSLIIADEPTTALDATLQAQILDLLRTLREETGVALLLITHDLGVVAGNCERLVVMDQGEIVEAGDTSTLFATPTHPQTRALLDAVRATASLAPNMRSEKRKPVLEASELSVSYPGRRGIFRRSRAVALQPIALELRPGETLAIVGESGSGKTSLARALLGLIRPASGTVSYVGSPLPATLSARRLAERRPLQLVFQDPVGSLNPAMRVRRIVAEPLQVHEPTLSARERREATVDMLQRVGLEGSLLDRFPHQLSGGQAQRVAIARALVTKPAVLICDEAVASLDSSIRHGILSLLAEEQRRTALSVVFISHDLAVVRQISHRVLVLYMGHAFEIADTEELFHRPRHPYTRGLIDSTPAVDPRQVPIDAPVLGEVSSIHNPPTGCVFHPRCRFAESRCRQEQPPAQSDERRRVACWRSSDLDLTVGVR